MPTVPSFTRRSYSGGAVATTLTDRVLDTDTTINVTDGSSLPLAPDGIYAFVTINRGGSNEERIAYSPRVGNSLQGVIRGVDGTSSLTHEAGETVEHGLAAQDLDEANELVSTFTPDDATAANTLVGAFNTTNAANANALTAVFTPTNAGDSKTLVTAANSAWTGYTPGMAVVGGSSFTVTSGPTFSVASYKQIGKVCHFQVLGSVTISGTGTGSLSIDLPVHSAHGGVPLAADAFGQICRAHTAGASGAGEQTAFVISPIGGATWPTGLQGFGISGTYETI